MKALKKLVLLLIIFFIAVLYTGCTEDKCETMLCENNGTCVNGICDCPDGYIGTNCENFDATQVQVLLNGGKTPKELFDGGIIIDSLYGKMHKGGYIFYFNTDNGTGMLAAAEDQSTGAEWGCFGIDIIGLANIRDFPVADPETEEGARIGDGTANTNAILAGCVDNGIAAKLCRDLVRDWFLPSRGELNLMYTNLQLNGFGGFAHDWYWSSTEIASNLAWFQDFGLGDQLKNNKELNGLVRPVRTF